MTATLEEVIRGNMVQIETIFELLAEKDFLTGAEVLDRIRELKTAQRDFLKGGGIVNIKDGNVTATAEEVAVYNMFMIEAIRGLLAERNMLSVAEAMERIKNLKAETKLTFRKPN
jgi:hypothetical protein